MDTPLNFKAPELYLNPRARAARVQLPRARAGAGSDSAAARAPAFPVHLHCTNLDEFFEVRVAVLQQHSRASASAARRRRHRAERRARAHPRARARHSSARSTRSGTTCCCRSSNAKACASPRATPGPSSRSAGCKAISSNEVPAGAVAARARSGASVPAHPQQEPEPRRLAARASDAFGREGHMALMRAPRSLPRIIRLPEEVAESAVRLRVPVEHPARSSSTSCSRAWRSKARTSSASRATASSSSTRRKSRTSRSRCATNCAGRGYAKPVRLEIADNCPKSVADLLCTISSSASRTSTAATGRSTCSRITAIYDQVDRPDLKFPPFMPRVLPAV